MTVVSTPSSPGSAAGDDAASHPTIPPRPAGPPPDTRSAPRLGRPLVPLAICLASGIGLGVMAPGLGWVLGLAAGAALLMVARAWRTGRPSHPAPALALFGALGYLAILPWTNPWLPPDHVAHLPEDPMEIRARVVEAGDGPPGRQRLTVDVEAVGTPGGWRPARGRVRLTLINGEAPVTVGGRVEFKGRMRRVHNFDNPGGFDYRRHLALQGIHRTSFVDQGRVRHLTAGEPPGFRARVEALRSRQAALVASRVANPEAAAVLQALVLGVRGGLTAEVRQVFQDTGVAHLLAISGLHVSIVALVTVFLTRGILSHSAPLRRRGWVRPAAALLALGPVLSYGVLAGLAPATQRAMVMVAAGLAAVCLGRSGDGLNFLAAAALVLLIIHPPLVAGISFQLSFTAVAAIVLGLRALPARQRPEPQTLAASALRAAGGFALVTGLAFLGTLPLVLLTFSRLSLVSLVGNAVAVPLIGFVAVPLGLLGTALGAVSEWGAEILLQGAAGAVTWALAALRLLADWPWAAVNTFRPTVLEVGLYYGGLGALLVGRRAAAGRLVLLLVLVAVVGDGLYWAHRRFWHLDLKVTVVDVGQGNATLLELPRGGVVVVDGGGQPGNEGFDMGARVVAPLLRRRKILTVDHLVLSHANSDHLNGLFHLAEAFHVRTLLSNGEWADSAACRAFLELLDRKGVARPCFEDLPPRLRLHGVDLEILNPPPAFRRRVATDRWRDLNNNSLALRIAFDGQALLVPGDIKAEAENEMVDRWGPGLRSEVIVAPHHGSRSSSTERFLEAVAPQAVVFSAGYGNRYGFPHPQVVDRYRRRACHLFRTDRDGAVEIAMDAGGVAVQSRNGRRVRLPPPTSRR